MPPKYTGKKFCEYCRINLNNNKSDVEQHERGLKHKEAVKRYLADAKRTKIEEEKNEREIQQQLRQIEAAAHVSYHEKLNGGVNITAAQLAIRESGIGSWQAPSIEEQQEQHAARQAQLRQMQALYSGQLPTMQTAQISGGGLSSYYQQQLLAQGAAPIGMQEQYAKLAKEKAKAEKKELKKAEKERLAAEKAAAAKEVTTAEGGEGEADTATTTTSSAAELKEERDEPSTSADPEPAKLPVASLPVSNYVNATPYGAWQTVSVRRVDEAEESSSSESEEEQPVDLAAQLKPFVPSAPSILSATAPIKFSLFKKREAPGINPPPPIRPKWANFGDEDSD